MHFLTVSNRNLVYIGLLCGQFINEVHQPSPLAIHVHIHVHVVIVVVIIVIVVVIVVDIDAGVDVGEPASNKAQKQCLKNKVKNWQVIPQNYNCREHFKKKRISNFQEVLSNFHSLLVKYIKKAGLL